MFKEIIKNIKFKENEHSEYSYASETEFCERKLFYKRMGNKSYHDFSTAVNFAQGNAIHDLVQTLFEQQIAPQLHMRAIREVRINNEVIHGFIDVFLVNDKTIHLIELKTTKELPKKPMAHHVAQLNTYMQPYVANQDKHHKEVKGTLFYIEKAILNGNSPQAEFDIEFDEDLYINTMMRANEVKEYIARNELPPAEALITKSYWECRYCSYFSMCRKAGREAQPLNEIIERSA